MSEAATVMNNEISYVPFNDSNTTDKGVPSRGDSNSKRYKEFLFDSVCTNFHFQVFMEQILSHLVIPLSVIFVNVKAQGFWAWNSAAILFNIIIPCSVYLMICTYLLSSNENLGVLVGSIWVPLMFFVQHRLTVALKYASLSVSEYRKFQNCEDMSLSAKYNSQMELLQSWTRRDKELIEFELGCAAVRTATKLNEVFFIIRDPENDESARNTMRNWNDFVKESSIQTTVDTTTNTSSPLTNLDEGISSPQDSVPNIGGSVWDPSFFKRNDGSFCISVHDVCKLIILKCDCPPNIISVMNMGGFCIIALVLIFPYIQIAYHPIQATPSIVIFLICCSFLNILMGFVYVMLLTVVIKDAARHVNMIQFIHSLIRLTDLRLDLNFTLWSPRFYHTSSYFFKTREDAIARANYELIQSLTERHSPEEAYQNIIDSYSLNDDDLLANDIMSQDVDSSRPVFLSQNSSQSSSTSSWALSGSDKSLNASKGRRRRFSNKKSTMMGEFVVEKSSKIDASSSLSLLPSRSIAISETVVEENTTGIHVTTHQAEPVSTIDSDIESNTTLKTGRPPLKKVSAKNTFHTPPNAQDAANKTGVYRRKCKHSAAGGKKHAKARANCTQDLERLYDNAYTKLPRLDMNIPDNVSAWIACRLTLQHFGERFRSRVDIYVMSNSIVIVGFMVSVLILLLTAKNRESVFASVFLIQACLLIALSFVYIIILASFQALGNAQLAQHQRTLSSHALRMRHEVVQMQEVKQRWEEEVDSLTMQVQQYEPSPVEANEDGTMNDEDSTKDSLVNELQRQEAKLHALKQTIEQVEDALAGIEASIEISQLHTELKPLQLFGFRVESSLVFSIFTTAASFFLVILSLYSDSVANAGSALL